MNNAAPATSTPRAGYAAGHAAGLHARAAQSKAAVGKAAHGAKGEAFDLMLELMNSLADCEITETADAGQTASGAQTLQTYLQTASANGVSAGDALSAWLASQGEKAAAPGEADKTAEGEETGEGNSSQLLAALMANGWTRGQGQTATSAVDTNVRGAKTRQQSGPTDGGREIALQPKITTGSEKGKSQVWDIKDLSVQLRAAMQAIQPGQTSAMGMKSQTLQTAVAQALLDATALKQAANGKGNSKSSTTTAPLTPITIATKAPAAPAPPEPSVSDAAHSAAKLVAVAATTGNEQLESRVPREPQPHSSSDDFTPMIAAPLDWTAQHVRAADGTSHAPHMVEQMQQLSDFLAQHSSGNVRLGDKGVEANMKMYPPDLGGVKVVLNVRADHTATAQFTVERPETAVMLQDHMAQFKDNLSRHGLAVDRIQINVDARVTAASEGSAAGWNDRQPSSKNFGQDNFRNGSQDAQSDARQQGSQGEFSGRHSNTSNDPGRWSRAYDEARTPKEQS